MTLRWLLIFLALVVCTDGVFAALPEAPASRVADTTKSYDAKTREFLSRTLKAAWDEKNVSVYLATLPNIPRGRESATADKLRNAWIKEPVGLVVLYSLYSDTISISLTDDAFRRVEAGGDLEGLASRIDQYNEDGPSRGMPKVIDLLLERLGAKERVAAEPPPRRIPRAVKWTAAGVFFLVALWVLLKLLRSLVNRNAFSGRQALESPPVKPVLGATSGGLNTASTKY
jgi:hypothetical protein